VLVPDQVVDLPIVAYLAQLLQTQKSIDIHGLALIDGEMHLRVLTLAEQAGSQALWALRKYRPNRRLLGSAEKRRMQAE
jgi:hypothetical protein